MILRKLGGRGGEGVLARAVDSVSSGGEGFPLFGPEPEFSGTESRDDPLALTEPVSSLEPLESPVLGDPPESPKMIAPKQKAVTRDKAQGKPIFRKNFIPKKE